MKFIHPKIILVNCFYLMILNFNINAQWMPEIRLTNAPGLSYTSYNNAWPIAASGDSVHVFFSDTRDGNDEIYYKRSTDGGSNWSNDVRLTNAPGLSWCPSVVLSGSTVHITWYDKRDGNEEIYYKRSTDAGLNWEPDLRITNASGYSGTPSLAISGNTLHLVWEDKRDGNSEIYYKKSTNLGNSWGADFRLTDAAGTSEIPSIAVSGSTLHVSWDDNRFGNFEIFYKRSTDSGTTWETEVRLTNNILTQYFSCIGVSGKNVHIVWDDNRFGFDEIFYKRSTNGGITWGVDTRLTNTTSVSEYPNIALSGSNIHLVWDDDRNTDYEIYYKHSTDNGETWGEDVRLTNVTAMLKDFPSVAVSKNAIHVVWEDIRQGDGWEIYYKKNPTGNTVNIKNITSEIPQIYSLEQNYPNPFNPLTHIRFQLPKSDHVRLTILDILGREVFTILDENLSPGTYEIEWDASDYSSGVYYYHLQTEKFTETKKMVVTK